MTIENTFIDNLFLIDFGMFKDKRGEFVKTINSESFNMFGLEYKFEESFFSVSGKNVIRGMHFQIPPDDHCKLVYCVKGRIIDVVLDIRKDSKTFGKYLTLELSDEKRMGLYIGKGLAHGFLSLTDDSIVEYHTTTPYSAVNEAGIKFDSFGCYWNVDSPILSDRDLNFPTFEDYKSPF